ncbi:MAG: protein kinase [Calditrichaeota bacterium]|nr:protein kinase [Calditrichota bacterium]
MTSPDKILNTLRVSWASGKQVGGQEAVTTIGKQMPHYKILTKLGEGGMGVVYKAEDTRLKRLVALKFLSKELTRRAGALKRFVNEARAASPLDHPNICTVHEIAKTEDGQIFFVMAYCEGESLRVKINRGSVKVDMALDYAIQIASGLAAAHQLGIVHRDIKPANCIVSKNGFVKIVDFGIAKVAGVDLHTKTGARFGTISYMSPEQALGQDVDSRTDIWSFGVTLYELLSGRRPFQGEHEGTIINGILNKKAPPMADSSRQFPLELEEIVDRATMKTPNKRYQDTDDMLVDLRYVAEKSFGKRRRSSGRLGRYLARGAKRFFVSGILLGVLLFALGFWLQQVVLEQPLRQIAVADFINETEEEALDGLSGMLITALEQSRRFSVLTRSRMYDLHKQIASEDLDRIDETAARKICEYANINALALASIRKFDSLYTIDFKVIDPIEKEHLFTASEKGKGRASVPAMLDRLAQKAERGLKVSDPENGRAKQSVAQITTSSLEAYQHFFDGREFWYRTKYEEAKKELSKAIEIDSTFGLAHALLAIIYVGEPDEALAKAPLRKALQYIENIPARERYLVWAIDAYFREGYQAGIAVLREMEDIYPDDKHMHFALGYFYFKLQRFGEAQEKFEKVLELDPSYEIAQGFLSKTITAMK